MPLFPATIGFRSISKNPTGWVMPKSTTTCGAISPNIPMVLPSQTTAAPLPGTKVLRPQDSREYCRPASLRKDSVHDLTSVNGTLDAVAMAHRWRTVLPSLTT